MNIFLFIISVLVVAIIAMNQYIKYSRFKYTNNLKIIYDEMEMHFIKKDIVLNNSYIHFLKTFKNLSINPEFLDIQILMANKILLEKKGSFKSDKYKFDETLKSLGNDFEVLFKKFDHNTNEIIKLSIYKPDFVLFIVKLFFRNWMENKAYDVKKLITELKFAKDNDEVLSNFGMQLNLT